MNLTRRIRTILNGDQVFSQGELELLHTPAMQRLYDLHQLGFTDRVYVDASHSRLQHVIGAVHQADKLVTAIVGNLRLDGARRKISYRAFDETSEISSDANWWSKQVETNRPVIRLMALLHDITHAPFGHTLEDEIQVFSSKHDHPDRQAEAFARLLCQLIVWLSKDNSNSTSTPASVQAFILDFDRSQLPELDDVVNIYRSLVALTSSDGNISRTLAKVDLISFLKHCNKAMKALLHLELLHKNEKSLEKEPELVPQATPYFFEQLITRILAASNETFSTEDIFDARRDAYMLDLIGNTICADLLDYARRDAHFTNLKVGYDPDRIVENFTLVSIKFPTRILPTCQSRLQADPFSGFIIRPAIAVFGRKLRLDVPSGLMDLLQARFDLHERALYHPTKCVAGAMLGRALQLLGWGPSCPAPETFRSLGDQVFLEELRSAAKCAASLIQNDTPVLADDNDVLTRIIERLRASVRVNAIETAIAITTSLISEKITSAQALLRLNGAIELLNRISARRYHRTIFRLLPRAWEHTPVNILASSEGKLPVQLAADFFGDPLRRQEAEIKVEDRAGIERGGVTIHCPQYGGSAKIAEALLYSGTDGDKNGSDAPCTLRALNDKKDGIFGIFQFHGQAVQALERMYHSTWRMTVSVSPQYYYDHPRINLIISRVLTESLVGTVFAPDDSHWQVENDRSMQAELKTIRRPHQAKRKEAKSDIDSSWSEIHPETPLSDDSSDGSRPSLFSVDENSPPLEQDRNCSAG